MKDLMIFLTLFVSIVSEVLPFSKVIFFNYLMTKMMKDNSFLLYLSSYKIIGSVATIYSDKTRILAEN
jgi:magnesium-transporting ATPase (P-type)